MHCTTRQRACLSPVVERTTRRRRKASVEPSDDRRRSKRHVDDDDRQYECVSVPPPPTKATTTTRQLTRESPARRPRTATADYRRLSPASLSSECRSRSESIDSLDDGHAASVKEKSSERRDCGGELVVAPFCAVVGGQPTPSTSESSIAGDSATEALATIEPLPLNCPWQNCASEIGRNETLAFYTHLMGHANKDADGQYCCRWQSCSYSTSKRSLRPRNELELLKQHMLEHLGPKPFQCVLDGCNQRYDSPEQFELHLDSCERATLRKQRHDASATLDACSDAWQRVVQLKFRVPSLPPGNCDPTRFVGFNRIHAPAYYDRDRKPSRFDPFASHRRRVFYYALHSRLLEMESKADRKRPEPRIGGLTAILKCDRIGLTWPHFLVVETCEPMDGSDRCKLTCVPPIISPRFVSAGGGGYGGSSRSRRVDIIGDAKRLDLELDCSIRIAIRAAWRIAQQAPPPIDADIELCHYYSAAKCT